MITAKNKPLEPRELVPAGSSIARCFEMIHIGTIPDEYMGETRQTNKVRVSWELPTELRTFKEGDDPKPMVISKEYTLSMSEKANLRKDLESWRGKAFTEAEAEAFDITKLLGVPCMLSIIHGTSKKGNDYASVATISGMPKGIECPAQVNMTFEFNYDEAFSEELVEKFPDFIKDRIKQSEEYLEIQEAKQETVKTENTTAEPAQSTDVQDDDLPF